MLCSSSGDCHEDAHEAGTAPTVDVFQPCYQGRLIHAALQHTQSASTAQCTMADVCAYMAARQGAGLVKAHGINVSHSLDLVRQQEINLLLPETQYPCPNGTHQYCRHDMLGQKQKLYAFQRS